MKLGIEIETDQQRKSAKGKSRSKREAAGKKGKVKKGGRKG